MREEHRECKQVLLLVPTHAWEHPSLAALEIRWVCVALVGTEQTKGLGVLCLEQQRLGSSKPEVRLGLKEGQGKTSTSQRHKNEESLKLVASSGCPRSRQNGAIAFLKCLFSIIWDV